MQDLELSPHWEIFTALADRHVVYFGATDQEGHSASFAGDCVVCRPALAALRQLGWVCDARLAAELDAINTLAAALGEALSAEGQAAEEPK